MIFMGGSAVLIPVADYMPAWYELSWRGSKIVILIHRAAFEALKGTVWRNEGCIINSIKDEFSLPDYQPPVEGAFGFGLALKFGGLERNEWLAWECVLPKIDEEPEKWKRDVLALRATLSFLFDKLIILSEIPTGWQEPQLMVFEGFRVDKGLHGGSLLVALTPALVKWISRQGDCRLGLVIAAMKAMDKQLMRGSDCDFFIAECRQPNWLHLCVPGNACGLDPEYHADESLDVGYNLCPHNIDGSIQQLTFLAGLACLHDLARGDYHPQ